MKLSKQQVTALANKISKTLIEKRQAKLQEIFSTNTEANAVFAIVKELLDIIEDCRNKLSSINEENKLLIAYYNLDNESVWKSVLAKHIHKLDQNVPNLNQIIEEIYLHTIEFDGNVDEFIEELSNKLVLKND